MILGRFWWYSVFFELFGILFSCFFSNILVYKYFIFFRSIFLGPKYAKCSETYEKIIFPFSSKQNFWILIKRFCRPDSETFTSTTSREPVGLRFNPKVSEVLKYPYFRGSVILGWLYFRGAVILGGPYFRGP